jgi:hypothetical protein
MVARYAPAAARDAREAVATRSRPRRRLRGHQRAHRNSAEDGTTHPGGIEFIAALFWRGIVYGAADGLLLSAFPILLVFAALRGTRVRRRAGGLVAVGAVAMVASLAMTAVYHAGYSDFRSDKLRKPVTGDLVWSVPTLATLNPIGAPIAHVGLHVGAVVHSYDTDLFLPPH